MMQDDTNEKPHVEKFGARYWNSQIQSALDRHQPFFDSGAESIKLYKAKHELTETKRRLNIWWYSVNTLMPAYYSSTPKAQVKLRKRVGSLAAEAGAVILERNTQYCMDEDFDFDRVAQNATLQYLLTGRAILWARYEPEFETEVKDFDLFATDMGYVDGEQQPFDVEQEGLELTPGENGIMSARMTLEVKKEDKAVLECVQYDDFLTSDARNEAEIEWVARRAYLSREKAREMFGEVAEGLNYNSYPGDLTRSSKRDKHAYEGKAELWEIWCKRTEKVYWLQLNGDKSIIQEGEAPIDFEGFFPCVMINSSTDPETVIPTSDYVHCKDQILEVERLTTRIFYTIQAIRANGIYDATLGDEVEGLLADDLKLLPVQNATSLRQRGGLAGGIEFLNVAPYVNTLQVLQDARQRAISQLFETLKVSDLLRGASDPRKTATANRLESSWSSLGLIVRQNEFARFIGESISLLATIIAEQFEPETMFEVADADNFLTPQLPDPMMLEQVKMQVYDIISDDDQRCYRIQVSSDSMIALDQAQEKMEGLEMLQTVGSFFDQMKSMIEQYPPLATFSMAILSNLIRRFKGGEEVEGLFQNALGTITQMAQQREQAASQQQQPDPAMMQMQMQMQVEQMKADLKRYELDGDTMIERDKLFLDQQRLALQQQELEIKNNALQVEVMKVQAQTAGKTQDNEIKAEHNRMQSLLDLQRLELERVATRLSETEKLLEERRLAQQQQLEMLRMQFASEQAILQAELKQRESAGQPPINITNVIPKPSRRVGTIGVDEMGNTTLSVDNVEE